VSSPPPAPVAEMSPSHQGPPLLCRLPSVSLFGLQLSVVFGGLNTLSSLFMRVLGASRGRAFKWIDGRKETGWRHLNGYEGSVSFSLSHSFWFLLGYWSPVTSFFPSL